jgi:hypothetical protein
LPGIAHFRDNGEEACDALAGGESQGEQTGMQGWWGRTRCARKCKE